MSAHFSSPEEKQERKIKAYRASIFTALVLAGITVIEFVVSQIPGIGTSAIVMLLLGLVKAYFVVVNFMHVARLWLPEGEH